MIVLDIETTGLDPAKHGIVSVGAVEFENPDNQFYEECRVSEGVPIEQEAVNINGFSHEAMRDVSKQTTGSLLENLLEWIQTCGEWTIAGHNVHCDIEFIDRAASKFDVGPLDHGRGGVFHDRIIDTHSLVWMDLVRSGEDLPKDGKYSNVSSDFIFKYVGIDHERNTHNALEDAQLTAEAVSRLIYDKKLFDKWKQ
jgi:DNA polymerase III epsilon subunit-like protein